MKNIYLENITAMIKESNGEGDIGVMCDKFYNAHPDMFPEKYDHAETRNEVYKHIENEVRYSLETGEPVEKNVGTADAQKWVKV